jgi:ribosomal protein L37AE/L43A
VFVADLRHYLDVPDDLVDGPAGRLGRQLGLIVQAATARHGDGRWVSALSCPRRPNRQKCTGSIAVDRIGGSINWECTACHETGTIGGWEDSPFDIRPDISQDAASMESASVSVVFTKEVAVAFQSIMLLDDDLLRVVFGIGIVDDAAVLVCTENQLEELAEVVAAEANHTGNRRLQKLLDTAYEILTAAAS